MADERPLRIENGPAPDAGPFHWRSVWPSRPQDKDAIVACIGAVLAAACPLDDEERQWTRLCLDEAIINAIVHGNEADPSLVVAVRLWIDADARGWTVEIADQGRGFTPQAVPSHPADGTLLEHGRGVRILLEWLDGVRYYDGGRTVRLHRRLRGTGA